MLATAKVDATLSDGAEAAGSGERASVRGPRSYELEPGDVLDGLQIVRVLARCGMGSVFKAHERKTGATVVLKVPHMRFESDVVFYARFQREERIGLRLRHPGIARVLPAPEKSRPYIVFEYVEGSSLWHLLKSEGRLPVDRVAEIGRKICAALVYMHGEGVIHRDLKLENVILDGHGAPRIVDFGIALDHRDRRLTWGRFSNRLGTPEYMAPEQFRGRRGDARVDIYALGAMLYELASGATPFATGSVASLMRSKLHDHPKPLTTAAPDVDPAFASVVMRALARNPDERFSSAAEMLGALADPAGMTAVVAAARPRLAPRMLRWAWLCAALIGAAWIATRFG